MHVTRDLFHEVCVIRELFVFGRENLVSLRFLRQWLIQNVTREFCKDLCVKRDHDPPFASLACAVRTSDVKGVPKIPHITCITSLSRACSFLLAPFCTFLFWHFSFITLYEMIIPFFCLLFRLFPKIRDYVQISHCSDTKS